MLDKGYNMPDKTSEPKKRMKGCSNCLHAEKHYREIPCKACSDNVTREDLFPEWEPKDIDWEK